jgi:20S proteasome subunit alpha 5
VALLIAGVDEVGTHLYFADPSGTFMKYQAKAIGAGSEIAQNQLQEEYKKELSLAEAQLLALKILKQVMEEKLNATNVQIASVPLGGNFKIASEAEIQALIGQL